MNQHKSLTDKILETIDKRAKDITLEKLIAFVISPFLFWAIIHSISSRTLEDFIRYPAYIAVPVVLLLLIATLVGWVKGGFRRPPREDLIALLVSPLAGAFYGIIIYVIGAALKDAYLWLQAPSSREGLAVLRITVAVLMLGVLLFFFRLWLRSLYGLTEMVIGVFVAARRTSVTGMMDREDVGFYLALLTAGVYLLVRGLDNIHQGLTKDPRDPIATIGFKRLKGIWSGAEKDQSEEQLQLDERGNCSIV